MSSARRRQIIEQRLRSGPAGSQDEIAQVLRAHGIRTTQATISRDLGALGALKGPQGYVLPDDAARHDADADAASAVDRVVAQYALSVAQADSLVVIRTGPGHANLLGVAIDRRPLRGVVGCIAGDDTIFIATTNRAAAQRIAARLSRSQSSR